MFEGIVLNAVILTVSILVSLLLVYKSGYIKVTENFKLGIAAATGGIALVYFISIIASFFGINFSFLDSEVAIISLVAFLAAILTFFSGFGLGTILTPIMMIYFPVEIAVAFTGIVHFSNNIFKLFIVK